MILSVVPLLDLVAGVDRANPPAEALSALEGNRKILPRMRFRSDMISFMRRAATTYLHPVGTCKMGGDAMAVVDSHLRVLAIEGLRVADASIMPTVTTGNTNALTVMRGEMAASLIQTGSAPSVVPALQKELYVS